MAFYYGDGIGSSVTIGNATGLMVVDASDVKYFFTSREKIVLLSTEEQIQQGSNSVDVNWEYKYQTDYNEYNTNINACANTDTSTPNRRGSIEI